MSVSHCTRSFTEALAVGAVSGAIFLAGIVLMWGPFAPDVGKIPSSPSEGAPACAPRAEVQSSVSTAIPVLCHHYLRAKTTPGGVAKILGALFFNLPLLRDMDVWTQTAAMFDAQMAYLKSQGYETVDLADVVASREGLRRLPPKPIVITFDDGDRSVLEYAYPILKKYGYKATVFVVTSKVGQRWERVDCLDWDELRRLQESGVFSIQSHSHDLHRKVKTRDGDLPVFVAARRGLYEMPGARSWAEGVRADLELSKRLIENHIGNEATCLAWPYGFADAALDSVASAVGFSVVCTLAEGSNWESDSESVSEKRARDRLEMRRYTITARTSLRTFARMLAEGG